MIGLSRWLGAGIAVGLGLNLAASPAVAQGTPKDFKIGVVESLTGAFSVSSKDTMDGLQTWIKFHGLPGRHIVLDATDDQTNPVNATNAFRREASDPDVQLIYFFVSTNSALASKAFASEFKVPIISGGGAESLGVPPDPWLFKVAASSKDNIASLLDYSRRKGYTRLGTITSTDATGQTEIVDFKKMVGDYGISLVDAETFAVGDTNFNSQLARLRSAAPQIVYSGATAREGILVYKQFMQQNFSFPLVMNGAGITAAFYEAIGGQDKANGLLEVVQRGVFGSKNDGESGRLYERFAQELGHPPTYFNIFGYDVGLITGAAVTASDGTRQGIRDALEKLKDLPAVDGPVTFRPEDHTGQDYRSVGVGRLTDGVASPAD